MSIYRRVSIRMWGDIRFRKLGPLPPSPSTLWLYMLTGPHTCLVPGLSRVGRAGMAEALGWKPAELKKSFDEIEKQEMARWEDDVLWLPKAILHNQPESPNHVRGWRAHWELIPETPLKRQAWGELKVYTEGLGKGFGEAFLKVIEKPLPNQEQEQEQEQEQDKTLVQEDLDRCDPDQVMVFWNEICGASGLSRIRSLNSERRAKVRIRSKRLGTLKKWRAYFETIVKTPFLMGESKDGWRADFDFCVRSDGVVSKVREGSYLRGNRARPAPNNALDAGYQEIIDEESALTDEDLAELSNITETDNGPEDLEKADDISVRALPDPSDPDHSGGI